MEAIKELEKIKTQIEKETDFEKIITLFTSASVIVKSAVASGASAKGRLLEIIKELDQYIEKELKLSGGGDA